MDCGPAALSCLLEGHRIPVSYARLRDACQTDVDGTSISTIESVANELGLDAEEVLAPADHLLVGLDSMLPAVVVARAPDGNTHFIVAWRCALGFVQLMDPATGRRWTTREKFADSLYEHVATVPASAWRDYAAGDEFRDALIERMRRLGIGNRAGRTLLDAALQDSSWLGVATLDAAVRCASSLVDSESIRRGAEAEKCVSTLAATSIDDTSATTARIPRGFWIVQPAESSDVDDEPEDLLHFRGALLVRVKGRSTAASVGHERVSTLGRAITEEPARPGRRLLAMLREDGWFSAASLTTGLFLASLGLLAEGLLFRGMIELASIIGLADQRLKAAFVLASFLVLLFLIQVPITSGLLRAGRRLDARLRLSLHRKIPLLRDSYFRSRLVSDTAHRGHALHAIRDLPVIAGELVRALLTVVLIAAAIAWWVPESAWLAIAAGLLALGVPLLSQPLLMERDLRVHTHEGALSRFYLDALLGVVPLRVHGAAGALRRQHEKLLVEWVRARFAQHRGLIVLQGLQHLVGYSLAAWMLLRELRDPSGAGSVLLLAYWALQFPALGAAIAELASQYPGIRNTALRLLEPLDSPERERVEDIEATTSLRAAQPGALSNDDHAGVSVSLRSATVHISGLTLLDNVTCEIEPGEHIAVLGVSGAGKSTLLGLLHGWYEPADGRVEVDRVPLDEKALVRLRARIAWVDPSVQLWNRTLLQNIDYGVEGEASAHSMAGRIALADLKSVLEQLPDGQQSKLGESGGLVSGGEGQRVRFARGVARSHARLVLLDEPFRGLSRDQRRRLLGRARKLWHRATLFCATHDVRETLAFDRVLVLEDGKLVEDGAPDLLLSRAGSRYRALLEAERGCDAVWISSKWRRWFLRDGVLTEHERKEEVS